MTTKELRDYFNNTYGISIPWPKTYEVDAETYGNVCDEAIKWTVEKLGQFIDWDIVRDGITEPWIRCVSIKLGPNNGIMFKNVELILKK